MKLSNAANFLSIGLVWVILTLGCLDGMAQSHMPVKRTHTPADSVSMSGFSDSIPASTQFILGEVVSDPETPALSDSIADPYSGYEVWESRDVDFNPDPNRAVWMSALFPGLGQVYNRRYWKLPIVVGAYMGLGYATSWNNNMLTDYTRAYRDLMDNDPDTKSYMDFFPPTTQESDIDKNWLTKVMQSRKNFYRRNRDLCIIAMVGVYLVAMVDAYVDASLSHFDISPDLSLDMAPVLMNDARNLRPGVGFACALTF